MENNQYQAALAKNDAAIAAFKAAQTQYRAQQVGDAEFLAAKAAYDAAMVEFDLAYAAEVERVAQATGRETWSVRPEALPPEDICEQCSSGMLTNQNNGTVVCDACGHEQPEVIHAL